MNSMKRRQVTKPAKQTQIQFPQSKGCQDNYGSRQDFSKKLEDQTKAFDYQIGAKDSNTPYRSVNRINSLLKSSPYLAQHGHAKLIETPSKFFFSQLNQMNDTSKPSTATTAYTYAPSEYSSYKNDFSQPTTKKREAKSDRKNQNSRRLAGTKRPAQLKLEHMEYFLRLGSSAAKYVARSLKLRDKKTGQVIEFSLHDEDQIQGFRNNPIIKDFDMTKLEVEYDYDTDSEQLSHSAKMLWRELQQAIEFFIKDDPFKLVDNILL